MISYLAQQYSLNTLQKGCRALLPEIEDRLQAKAQWLAEVCEHQGI